MRLRKERQPGQGVRVADPRFYDFMSMYPELESTKLIMRVYEALEAKGIPFYYSYEFGDAVVTRGLKEHIRTHFFIPSINTAIIVQGGYWFDSASNLQDTALTQALLEHSGFKVLWWTEPEIMASGVDELIARCPELQHIVGTGEPLSQEGATIIPYRRYYQPPPRPIRKERGTSRRRRRRPK